MGSSLPKLKEPEAGSPSDVAAGKVWLFGDSILDNSYWNGVGANTTGEHLNQLLPNCVIRDRSTEELDAMTFLHCLQSGRNFQVRSNYVEHRKKIGIPYDDDNTGTGSVNQSPQIEPDDFVFLCMGGNDFALRGEMDPTVILDYVQQVIQYYVETKGVAPHRIFYMTPYPPTGLMKFAVGVTCRGNLGELYEQFLRESKHVCAAEGVGRIPLDHLGDDERAGPGTGIPEPTPKGARDLAVLIQQCVVAQIQLEQAAAAENSSNS